MFKVGDLIKGKKYSMYPTTNNEMYLARVIELYENTKQMRIIILDHKLKKYEGKKFIVSNEEKYFIKINSFEEESKIEYKSESSTDINADINRLEISANKVLDFFEMDEINIKTIKVSRLMKGE